MNNQFICSHLFCSQLSSFSVVLCVILRPHGFISIQFGNRPCHIHCQLPNPHQDKISNVMWYIVTRRKYNNISYITSLKSCEIPSLCYHIIRNITPNPTIPFLFQYRPFLVLASTNIPDEFDVNTCYFTGSSSSLKRYLKKKNIAPRLNIYKCSCNYYLIYTVLLFRQWEEL